MTSGKLITMSAEDFALNHEEVVRRSLNAFGLESACRREAERTNGEHALRCHLLADEWLLLARHYKRMAKTFEEIGQMFRDHDAGQSNA